MGKQADAFLKICALTQEINQTFHLDQILYKLAFSTKEIVESEACSILLVDEEKGELFFEVALGEKGAELSKIRLPLSRKSIAGWVAINQLPLIVNDVSKDPRHSKDVDRRVNFTTRNILAAPICWEQETLGVIEAVNKVDGRKFTNNDKEYLRILASQASVAIKNARLFNELRTAQGRMIQAEKLASIGILTSSIVHHIKGIVTVLEFPFHLLSQEEHVSDDTKTLIREAREAVHKLLLFTKKINSFSRPAELALEAIRMNEFIESLLPLVENESHKRHIRIRKELSSDIPPIQADPVRMEQVFINIILNAFEAMSTGGGEITISIRQTNGWVEMSIADTGPGISAENISKIFKPFYSTKHGGSGLGLFSCRQIVEEEHGGNLCVDSSPGKGCTFHVRLPKTKVSEQTP